MARRDQTLAVTAWQLVNDRVAEEVRGQFRTRAVRLGPMLVGSGLAATVAFHEAKAGPPPQPGEKPKPLDQAYRLLVDALARHVLSSATANGGTLIDEVGTMDSVAYRQASAQARAFALWVRRAAEALIPREDDTGSAA